MGTGDGFLFKTSMGLGLLKLISIDSQILINVKNDY